MNAFFDFRPDEAAVMKVLSKDKDSIMVSLDPPPINQNCVPEKYHLEYSASGREPYETQEFNPADVEVRPYFIQLIKVSEFCLQSCYGNTFSQPSVEQLGRNLADFWPQPVKLSTHVSYKSV